MVRHSCSCSPHGTASPRSLNAAALMSAASFAVRCPGQWIADSEVASPFFVRLQDQDIVQQRKIGIKPSETNLPSSSSPVPSRGYCWLDVPVNRFSKVWTAQPLLAIYSRGIGLYSGPESQKSTPRCRGKRQAVLPWTRRGRPNDPRRHPPQ